MATSPILRPAPPTLRRRAESRAKQTSLTLFPQAARHGNCESSSGASAPPPVTDRSTKPAEDLVGIARLAASSPCAEAKRGTEYFLLPVRSILNECHSERVPFRWTVNPYRGCEFGCKYCYARYTHEYMELDGGEFESKIYVKQDAGPLAERDLGFERVWGEHIAIGTATDPYQPAEKEFGATRAILERMAEREGLSISITTKSNQVLRDVELLQKIAAKSALSVNLSVTTLKTRLARLLEPRAPRPDLRLEAVRKLRKAGIAAGVLAMPVLAGPDRQREGSGRAGKSGERNRGAVVCGQCAVPDAGFAAAIYSIPRREISKAGEALQGVVRAIWQCARGISQGDRRAGGEIKSGNTRSDRGPIAAGRRLGGRHSCN